MRSHRVWSAVDADNYAAAKSFGGEFRQSIVVGSSAKYSNGFATIEVREVSLDIGDWSLFMLHVDSELTKRALFNNKTKQYQVIDDDVVASDAIAELES